MAQVDPYGAHPGQGGMGQGGFTYGESGVYPPTVAQPGVYPPTVAQPGIYPPTVAQPGVYSPTMAQPAPAGQVPVQVHPMVTLQMAQMGPLPPSVMCSMSNIPVNVQCPYCQANTTTTIEKETGGRAYFTLCAFTIMGCCCLPLLFWDQLKDVIHHCGNCKMELGRYVPKTSGGRGRRRRGRRR